MVLMWTELNCNEIDDDVDNFNDNGDDNVDGDMNISIAWQEIDFV